MTDLTTTLPHNGAVKLLPPTQHTLPQVPRQNTNNTTVRSNESINVALDEFFRTNEIERLLENSIAPGDSSFIQENSLATCLEQLSAALEEKLTPEQQEEYQLLVESLKGELDAQGLIREARLINMAI